MDEISRSFWLILCLLLVFLMAPGLGLIGSGCVRKKHSTSQLSSSLLLFIHGVIIFGLIGYGLIFGKEFFFFQNFFSTPSGGVPHGLLFLFQSFFFALSLIILQGVWAERAKQVPFLIFNLIWGMAVYFPVSYFLWNKGSPLASWKLVDFAGGLNVHVTTGFSALAMSILGGRRKDYYSLKFKFSNTSIFIGTIFLWLGWIGFNAGSSLILSGESIKAVVTTFLSSISSCIVWYWIDKIHTPHKSTLKGFALGLVCGLVVVTPSCGFLSIGGSLILGAGAGVFGNYSMRLMNKVFNQDDVLEVFSTHGVCGVLGSLFSLFFLDHSNFFVSHQILATFLVAIFSFLMTFLICKFFGISRIFVTDDNIEIGLDQIEHGEAVMNWDSGS